MEPEIPMPMYFLETNNDFVLGNAKLYLAPYVTTFPHVNWEDCVHETALRNVAHQQQPVVNAWDAVSAASAASSSSSAATNSSNAASFHSH